MRKLLTPRVVIAMHTYALFISLVLTTAAFADEPPLVQPEAQERVEVTGSHIRRTDLEGLAPVETITRKDLEKKGYVDLGEVVRDLGVSSFGTSGAGPTGGSGGAVIDLHGAGADNTLVLLNGQRLPPASGSGAVDINIVPMAAVERIEILKDGASAIYGSDALGGVVNIITKKDFEGTELGITQTLPTNYGGGKHTNISVVNGINKEKLNVVTAANFKFESAIYSRDRPWSDNIYSLIGNPASYASIDPATGPTGYHASPNCPPELTYQGADGTHCRYRASDDSSVMPRIFEAGVLSEAHYELSSDWRLLGRVNYMHRAEKSVLAPSPGTNITIPSASVGQFNLPSVTAGQNLRVQDRLTLLGPRVSEDITNVYGVLVGATHQLGHDWQLDLNASANLIAGAVTMTDGGALANIVKQQIIAGAYNPFLSVDQQTGLSGAGYQPVNTSQIVTSTVEAQASGELFQDGAGAVSLAFGTFASYANYVSSPDVQESKGNVIGSPSVSGSSGHRTSEALFAEFSIPLIEKKLEMQLAGRFDHYSDFGGTVNPKVGFKFNASKSLLFRASAGTGFRAPKLTELYAPVATGFPGFIDEVACRKNPGTDACGEQQYEVTQGGNPNLKEETSQSLTAGAVWAPSSDLSLGTDWFLTKIKNEPGIDLHQLTIAEANGANPAQYGVIVNRDGSGNLLSIVAPLQNTSLLSEAGVEVTGSYTFGKFKLATEYSQIFYYRTEGFPGAGLTNQIGWAGLPRWRNTTSLDYAPVKKHTYSITARTIPGQNSEDRTFQTGSSTTFDLSYIYRTKDSGEFSLGVINVVGTKPPYDTSSPLNMVNTSLYDPNGRQFVLGYRRTL